MISRRRFIGASAAALAVPPAGGLRAPRASAATQIRPAAGMQAGAAAATAATLAVNLQNNTGSDTVYAYVTGQALDNGNALMLLESDGQTPYYPTSPAAAGSPLAADCAIPLGASGGAPAPVTIPHLAGARIWFSIGSPLEFLLNPGPALVEPSVTNPSDPNIDLQWDFCELTYNDTQVFANISFVDFVCIPVALTLTGSAGTQTVPGLPGGGLDTVCAGLAAQAAADGNGWNDLIISRNENHLRALSPVNAMVLNSGLLAGYYDSYVSQVWQKYATTPLTVDTQASFGTVTGEVSGGLLTFAGVGSFAQPSAADIFSCNSGPFSPAGMSAEMLAILPRLAAAFNRSTLLIDASQPDGEDPADYYTNAITNHYARIVHATTTGGRGYAFPYDDVAPAGGADQSGSVSDPAPSLLTVTLGPVH
jgi:Beta-1,3-glucanase